MLEVRWTYHTRQSKWEFGNIYIMNSRMYNQYRVRERQDFITKEIKEFFDHEIQSEFTLEALHSLEDWFIN